MGNVWRGYKCYSAEIFLVITQPRVELWGRAGGWRERLNLHETSTAACAMGVRREQTQLRAECGSVQEIDIYSAGHRYRVLTAFTGSEQNYSFAQIRRCAKWDLTLDPTGLHLGYPSCKGSMQRNCKGESKLCRYFELTEKTLQCQFQAIPSQGKRNFAQQHPR